ncbi:antibiotic biosynthesis monooxygenase [Empedobacter falsenii]|uniref:antibiotic biosynthesis monooxygenase n=1 Tax=Empedobacter falsenii TaxID=343874 RepID=UPI000A61E101|nr:antibiotic biosynthesis monooxygenase [Empedobacter falsenii]
MTSILKGLSHDIENFNYIISGNMIVVEGTEKGITINDKPFPDNVTAFGKFCNVFEFEGNLIKRVHIYVDPDFTSEDNVRMARLNNNYVNNKTDKQEVEVIVEFSLKPNVIDNFEAILLPHLERLASEQTCITMIANRDPNDETRYMLYERWADKKEFLEVQMKRPYRVPYEEKIQALEANPRKVSIWESTLIRNK